MTFTRDSRQRRSFVLGCVAAAVSIPCIVGCGSDQSLPTEDQSTTAVAEDLADEELRELLDEVLDFTAERRLSADEHAAWQILHGVLAYGKDFKVWVNGELTPALDWAMNGGDLRGWTMRPTDQGLLAVLEAGTKTGQGHEDQWFAIISQCGVGPEDPIIVRGAEYHVADIVRQSQWNVREGMEGSWTIIGLSAYLSDHDTWQSHDGTEWNLERLVASEAKQGLAESACGGSHRLIGLSMALNRHLDAGGEVDGAWADADRKIQDAIEKARQFQHPSGALSSSYFERASYSPDVAVQINKTGHTLEFLVLAMTDEQLHEPWVTRAATYLCRLFQQTRDLPIECGSLYHAAHGLQLYRLRRFGPREFAEPAITPTVDSTDESPPVPPDPAAVVAE